MDADSPQVCTQTSAEQTSVLKSLNPVNVDLRKNLAQLG
jgi:hypothetical protein